MSKACHGNQEVPCCFVAGARCPFLEENTVPGRRWVCGLRRELGNWDKVHNDPRYLATVKPEWEKTGTKDCGDFGPAEGQCCFSPTGKHVVPTDVVQDFIEDVL